MKPGQSNAANAVAPPVVWVLRLEGLAVAVPITLLYAQSGASWALFAALWLVPDLSAMGYLAGPRWGALCYNTIHSYALPAFLGAVALLLHRPALLPFALIWFHHIGVDRMLGYGLKYPTGFGFTHLKRLGKAQKELL